jgi:hypothetical protein
MSQEEFQLLLQFFVLSCRCRSLRILAAQIIFLDSTLKSA